MIVYFIIYRGILAVFGIAASSLYNSPENALNFSLKTSAHRILSVVDSMLKWFLNPSNSHISACRIINILLAGFAVYFISLICIKKKIKGNQLLVLLLFLCMVPFGMSIVCFISGVRHDLTVFSYFLCYLLTFVLYEIDDKELYIKHPKLILCVISTLCFLLIFDNCIFSNQIYLKKELILKSTDYTITRIIDRIEQTEGYQVGETPVVLIGNLSSSEEYNKSRTEFPNNGFALGGTYAVTYYETYKSYFDVYLNYPINLQDESTSIEWSKKGSIQGMPSFPNKDSCQMIDGVMVVKLSEYSEGR